MIKVNVASLRFRLVCRQNFYFFLYWQLQMGWYCPVSVKSIIHSVFPMISGIFFPEIASQSACQPMADRMPCRFPHQKSAVDNPLHM